MKFRDQNSLLKFLILAANILWLCTANAAGKPVKVEAVIPNIALPGEAVSVVISGSGFHTGDNVKFFITETNDSFQINVVPGSVISNSKGTQLTASIEVLTTALISLYDIEVTSSINGRRGKDTTLFSVKKTPDPVVTLEITYNFGVLDGSGLCAGTGCVSTTITATGSVECGQNDCNFTSNAQDALFALPSGLRDLLSPHIA